MTETDSAERREDDIADLSDESAESGGDEGNARRRTPGSGLGRIRRAVGGSQGWITTLVAVAALLLSIVNTIQANSGAQMTVALPVQIRLAQDKANGFDLYMQPTFLVTNKSDTIASVVGLQLHVNGPSGPMNPQPYWRESGKWEYDSTQHSLDYLFVSDPEPFVVSQTAPQVPLLTFKSPTTFSAGQWDLRLTVQRAGQPDTSVDACLTLRPEDISNQERDGFSGFETYRTDWAGEPPNGCFRSSKQN